MLNRYGIEAESQYVRAASTHGMAHVLVAGEGPPVVMVGGMGIPAAAWAPLMAELRGFRLYAVDLPGFGLTDITPWFTADLRFRAVRFLSEVLDELELDHAAFVGSYLGSLWSSWLSLDLPRRVTALVHAGCPAMVLDTSAPLAMRLLSMRVVAGLSRRLVRPSRKGGRLPGGIASAQALVPELVDLLAATGRQPAYGRTFVSMLHALITLWGSRAETRLTRDQLARIHHPALLIWGTGDPFGAPAVGKRIVAAMPHAELHTVPGGYCPWLAGARDMGPIAAEFLNRHQ
ncbi:alpha/beta fold hydrolase [Thioalkalivibrio denitrificans]|nr:alpha/beta hydrolase [Thioalkalivibrio denitrificans]